MWQIAQDRRRPKFKLSLPVPIWIFKTQKLSNLVKNQKIVFEPEHMIKYTMWHEYPSHTCYASSIYTLHRLSVTRWSKISNIILIKTKPFDNCHTQLQLFHNMLGRNYQESHSLQFTIEFICLFQTTLQLRYSSFTWNYTVEPANSHGKWAEKSCELSDHVNYPGAVQIMLFSQMICDLEFDTRVFFSKIQFSQIWQAAKWYA